MSDVVDASVPLEWISKFVGHRIWSRPDSRPGAQAEFCELLDIWEESGHRPDNPFRFRASIRYQGAAHVATLAKAIHVEGVPSLDCYTMKLPGPDKDYVMHKWTPPFDDPPEVAQRDPGFVPELPAMCPQMESLSSGTDQENPSTVETECGDQFVLPIG